MAIKSFRVGAADNGYTLSYCEETKSIGAGTYANTSYKDHELVFTKKAELLVAISGLLEKLTNKEGKQVIEVEVEGPGEMEG